MAILIKVAKDPHKGEVPIPLWIPDHYGYERHMKNVEARLQAYQDQQTAQARADRDHELRDTKPDFYVDKSVPGRTIITVGAGELFREDLIDMAKRTLEKPDPRNNPDLSKRARILNDLDTRDFAIKRARKGVYRSFSVPNNPLNKDG